MEEVSFASSVFKDQKSFPTHPVSWEKQNNASLIRKEKSYGLSGFECKNITSRDGNSNLQGSAFYNELRRKYNCIQLKKSGLEMIKPSVIM